MTIEEIKEKIDKEVKEREEKTIRNGEKWYGAGLPMERNCSECDGRAEKWAEFINCSVEEIFEAMNL